MLISGDVHMVLQNTKVCCVRSDSAVSSVTSSSFESREFKSENRRIFFSSSSSWVWFSDSHWLSFTYWKTEKQPKNKSDVKWAQWTWQDLFCDYKLTWFVIDAWFLIIILVWSMAVFTPPPRPASRLIFSLNAPFFNHFTKCRKCLVYFFPRSVLLSLLWQCHDSDIWYPRARYQIKTLLSASV